jgi:hypothetical protein
MSLLDASLRSFASDTEWNFGGGRYLDTTTPSIKLLPLSRRNLSAKQSHVIVTKMAHGKVEARGSSSRPAATNSYCLANPSCAAIFNWRACCASVVQVGACGTHGVLSVFHTLIRP